MSRRAAIGIGIFAVAALGLAVDRHHVRRIHDDNLTKAEHFKREFDQRLTVGSSLRSVEDYLQSKAVVAVPEVNRDYIVRELKIEVAHGRSPAWACWRESVGLISKFVDERLQRVEIASWTCSCVYVPFIGEALL